MQTGQVVHTRRAQLTVTLENTSITKHRLANYVKKNKKITNLTFSQTIFNYIYVKSFVNNNVTIVF